MSAEQFDRRGCLKTAGGVAAGAAVSASLAGRPDTAAAASPAASPAAGPKGAAASHNPFITDIYPADPDAFVFGGRLYVDTDRHRAPLGATDFVMTDWHVYSTTDTVTWTYQGVRMSLADFPWANRNAWAPQMVHRDGRFYWYVPVQQASTGAMTIAVAVGDSTLGPFTDALGGPLIDRNVPNHSAFDIDPTVLVDDDGQAYIYWGSFSSPRAAKLKDNMIELAELGDDAPGGGGQATGPRATGRLGNAVTLDGVADYIALPAGMVSGLADFTIAAWINPAAIPTWSRIFDFGTGTGTYMFLTVNAGGGPRFAISTGGAGGEQRLSRTGQLPTGTLTHVAVTLAGTTGTLYVNGAPAATNTAMTLRPADLGTTTNNWIGRSQFSDPFLAATVDDVHALDAGEVATLAGGRPGAGNVAAHVAVTKSALVATLYVNGVQVGQNSHLGLYPARLGDTANNWIGRSQNPADPFLAADIDDVRIYQRGLDAVELAQMVVPGLIHGLADFIAGQPIGGGMKRSLTAKLGTALALLSAGHAAEAIGVINDDFVGEIKDLRGSGRLPEALATELVRWAALITANIARAQPGTA